MGGQPIQDSAEPRKDGCPRSLYEGKGNVGVQVVPPGCARLCLLKGRWVSSLFIAENWCSLVFHDSHRGACSLDGFDAPVCIPLDRASHILS